MEFKRFALAISQTKVARFANDLAEGKIMSTTCKKCGKRYYPPRSDCSICMTSEMTWVPIGGEGKLATYTKIFVPPEHFAVRQPLMPFSGVQFEPCPIGILEVEGGLRVMGWMPKVDVRKVRVGMKMRCLPQVLPDGNVTIILEAV